MLDTLMAPFDALETMRELGGPVVDAIFVASLLMWGTVIERYWFYRKILPQQAAVMLTEWQKRGERGSWRAQQIRKLMISRLNAGMQTNLKVMQVLVPLCPLLGLLGTVSGMLDVFDSMAARGSADARSMANGVSEAMTCTLTGLAVSMTGLFPVYYFHRKARVETERLSDRFTYT